MDIFAKGEQAMATSRPNVLIATQTAGQWTLSNPANVNDATELNSILRIGNKMLMGVRNSFGILDLYHSADQGATCSKGSSFSIAATASFLEKGDSLIIYGSRGGTPACFVADVSGNMVSNLSTGLFGWSFNDGVPSMTPHKGYLYAIITSFGSPFTKIRRYPLASGTFWEGVKEKIDNQFFGATPIASWNDTLLLGMIHGGVKISADDGLTWANYHAGLDSAIVNQFHIFGDFLAAATNRGLYLLQRGQTTWTNLSQNLPVSDIIKVQSTDGYLWALTENGGVWRLWRGNGNVSVDPGQQEALFSLYPNPASEELTMNLSAKGPGHWRMLDLKGRVIHSGEILPHSSQTRILLHDLPSGVYLLHTTIGRSTYAAPFFKQ